MFNRHTTERKTFEHFNRRFTLPPINQYLPYDNYRILSIHSSASKVWSKTSIKSTMKRLNSSSHSSVMHSNFTKIMHVEDKKRTIKDPLFTECIISMFWKYENQSSSRRNKHLTNISLSPRKGINSRISQLNKACIEDIPISNYKERMSEIDHDHNLHVKDDFLIKNKCTVGFITHGKYSNRRLNWRLCC